MLVVKCIDASNTNALKENEVYYAFPLNETMQAAYISRFPRIEAHTGCFQLSRFVEVEQVAPIVEAYEIHFKAKANNKTYKLYGFDIDKPHMVLYKDSALSEFFACVHKEKCTKHKKLTESSVFARYSAIPTVLRLGDFEGIEEVLPGRAEAEQCIQLSLF